MKNTSRNYFAKLRKLTAKFVEGASYLTKDQIYLALSDVEDNRVQVKDDTGKIKWYLASHFIWAEPFCVLEIRRDRGTLATYYSTKTGAISYIRENILEKSNEGVSFSMYFEN